MDENLSGLDLADTLNARGEEHGCTFVTFPERYEGADDEDLPGIAREVGATALLSINVQGFGAKEQYFRALVEGEPSKKTEKGLEIPVPRADEFFALLKNEIRKAAPRREKPSRSERE